MILSDMESLRRKLDFLLLMHTLYSLIRAAYFLYGALVVTLRTCYGALQIVVLLLLLLLFCYTNAN